MAASLKKSMSGKKRKLADTSVDEFMAGDFDSSGTESDLISSPDKKAKQGKNNKQGKNKQNKQMKKKQPRDEPPKQQGILSKKMKKKQPREAAAKHEGVLSKHKSSLDNLKSQDPEFYKFLKDEDESLLKFDNLSGSDVSDTSDDDDDTSKSDDVDPDDGNDDDDDEIDIGSSSDDEISQNNIMAFLAKKNQAEIDKKKAEMEKMDKKKRSPNIKKFEDHFEKEEDNTVKDRKTKKDKQKEKRAEKKDLKKSEKQQKVTETKVDKKKEEKPTKKKPDVKTIQKKKQQQADDSDDDDDDDDDDDAEDFNNMQDDESDEDDELGDDDFDMDASETDSDDEGGIHKPPEELEVMNNSDDDDDEEARGKKRAGSKTPVTSSMVKQWTKRFKTQPSPSLVHEAVSAFKAAVQHTSDESINTKYHVEGSQVYNAVVRMCLVEMPSALQKILGLPAVTDLQKPVLPSSNDKHWKRVRADVRTYLVDVLQLLTGLTEANMVNVLLKHVLKLVAYYACFTKITKLMLKKVINLWSSGEETSRVLSFLCVNRMIRINQETMLETCVKQLYMAYVRNSKFTSPNTLPLINFMQRSFVEVLALDYNLAYQYAFIYIRQLAIHLRNAITTKKKESCQAVYNWQYVHCISLWSRVLCTMYPSEVMEPLIYPLVQVIIGTVKLIPTQRYFPLRFHCVRALTMMSKSTRTFIPVLPFLMEGIEPGLVRQTRSSCGVVVLRVDKKSPSLTKVMNYNTSPIMSFGQQVPFGFQTPQTTQTSNAFPLAAAPIASPSWAIPLLEDVKNIKAALPKVDEIEQSVKAMSIKIPGNETKVSTLETNVQDMARSVSFY